MWKRSKRLRTVEKRVKGQTCRKLWLAMIRASWAPSSSGWAWLLLIPCTNWGMLSATAYKHKGQHCTLKSGIDNTKENRYIHMLLVAKGQNCERKRTAGNGKNVIIY